MENIEAGEGPALSRELWRAKQAPREARTGEPASRAEMAANVIADLAATSGMDERLGSKDELRQRCEVSVGTFNEALKLAQMRGVVTLRRGPGGGIFAARQTPLVRLGNQILEMEDSGNIVADIQRMRNALDPLIIEDALMHSSGADILDLRDEIKDMHQALAKSDIPAFLHGNWRFQARITSICPNQMLRSVSLSLLEILEQRAVSMPLPPDESGQELLEHRFGLYERMADALEARDREAAMDVLREHSAGIQPTQKTTASAGT